MSEKLNSCHPFDSNLLLHWIDSFEGVDKIQAIKDAIYFSGFLIQIFSISGFSIFCGSINFQSICKCFCPNSGDFKDC